MTQFWFEVMCYSVFIKNSSSKSPDNAYLKDVLVIKLILKQYRLSNAVIRIRCSAFLQAGLFSFRYGETCHFLNFIPRADRMH